MPRPNHPCFEWMPAWQAPRSARVLRGFLRYLQARADFKIPTRDDLPPQHGSPATCVCVSLHGEEYSAALEVMDTCARFRFYVLHPTTKAYYKSLSRR